MQKLMFLLILSLNVGLIALLAVQIRTETVSFLSLRSEDGFLFLETLTHHIQTSLEQIDNQRQAAEEKLNAISAALAKELPSSEHLKDPELETAARKFGLSAILFLDEQGTVVSSSSEYALDTVLRDFLSVCSGELATKSIPLNGHFVPDLAVGRHVSGRGALVLVAESHKAEDWSLSVDFDRLMGYDDLTYLVFESFETVHFSSPPELTETPLTPIRNDPAVVEAIYSDEPFTRQVEVLGERVLECVWPIYFDNVFVAVIKVGLSLDFVQHLEHDFKKTVAMAGILILLLDVLFVYSLSLTRRLGRDGIRFRSVLEGIGDGVVIFEENERVFGNHRIEALLGEHWLETINSVNGNLEKIEYAGKTLLILRNATEAGRIFIVRDISMDNIAEKAREREKRIFSMGKLVSVVAHEIRNPLNSISMIIQQLSSQDPKKQKMLHIVNSEVVRLNHVVNEFIEITKIPMLTTELTLLETLLKELTEMYSAKSQAEGFTLKISSSLGHLKIPMDREKMKGVLINLVHNSVEAGANHITVTASLAGRFVKIEIRDDGKGMDQTTLEKAFDLYYTTKTNGSGLGLPHIHRVVSAHSGFVKAESEEGKGTVVSLFLPVEREEKNG